MNTNEADLKRYNTSDINNLKEACFGPLVSYDDAMKIINKLTASLHAKTVECDKMRDVLRDLLKAGEFEDVFETEAYIRAEEAIKESEL